MFKNLKLRTRILISTGLVFILSFCTVIYIVSLKSADMVKTSSHQVAQETANKNATYIQAELAIAMDSVRTLSSTFEEMERSHEVNRETINKILVNVLNDNPEFVATWTLWEPNALDGRDNEYKNKPGYDATGRFIPYWSKRNGVAQLEPLVNYNTPGAGDYYLIPKKTRQETITEPYEYPITGRNVLITSAVVPIIIDGNFVGVVGIDIALDTIQQLVLKINPLETGDLSLLSNSGMYVAQNNSSLIGTILEDRQAKEAIKSGQPYTTTDNNVYHSFVPIKVGRTNTPWSMEVSVPLSRVLEQAYNYRDFVIIIGIVTIIIISLTIFVVASRISNQQLKKEVWERQQIQEKVLRLASIVESTDDGILGMTQQGIILDWNRGAERIYGYTAGEIIGKSISRLIPSDRQKELADVLTTISLGQPVTHFEAIRQRKDGQLIYVHLTISPIRNHFGKIMGASTVIRDVTAQKKMEIEMTRMDQLNLVGEMAASLGHEIRNPMTTVRGFLQLLGGANGSDHYSNYIPLMISELDRANEIITEFLSISRTKITEFSRHNLNDIITNILPLIRVDATQGSHSVISKLGVIPDLMLDEKEIRQVLINLTRNGLEAMSEGGNLIIETYVKNDQVVLAIQDEGECIKPDVLDRLGTPFFTTKEKGTGLGLAVCFGIAARHNAKVTIETSPMGSTFFVKFDKSFDLN